jgi:membrane peptidoglycan carboxypeptidase
MKPYTLATALEQGISVTARRDGSSPQTFKDRTQPVANAGGAQCASCTLQEAITRSLNTTFYGLAYEVGAEKVRSTALAAMDLPETWPAGNLKDKRTLADPQTGQTGGAIGIGQYELRPIDQAHGFATFASGGMERDPYFVARIADSSGAVLKQNTGDPGKQAIPADVANDVTYALEGVAQYSKRSLAGGRPVASKTGTQGLQGSTVDDTDAWMVGYTPSISTAVWMGGENGSQAIVNSLGNPIYGSGLPGAIWQEFMNRALAGTPEEALPNRAIIKGDTGHGVPEPTKAPTPTTSRAPATTTEAPRTTTEAPSTTESTTPSSTKSTGSTSASSSSRRGGGSPSVPAPSNNAAPSG